MRYRKAQHEAWLTEIPPDVFIASEDGELRAWTGGALPGATVGARPRPAASPDGDKLAGIAVSPGTAQGRVRVLKHPHEGNRLLHGEILVAS